MSHFMRVATSRSRGPFVENNFSTLLYTGNGASRNLQNNLDLLGRGGLVVTRRRDSPLTGACSDTVTGANNGYYLSAAAARTNLSSPTAYRADGYTVGNAAQFNTSGGNYASWAFKKAPRFFDVVAFTSDGTANQRVPHELGVAPGMVMVRAAAASSPFYIYNKGVGRSSYSDLSTANAFAGSTNIWGTVDPSATDMGINAAAFGFGVGTACLMYLFADDSGSKGLIRSGTFTTNASGSGAASLGWEPQMALIKLVGGVSDWECFDQTRGWASGSQLILPWSSSAAENNTNSNIVLPSATGVQITGGWGSSTIAYMAIRKGPMKT